MGDKSAQREKAECKAREIIETTRTLVQMWEISGIADDALDAWILEWGYAWDGDAYVAVKQ